MSDQPYGMLRTETYQAHIRDAADGLLAVVERGSGDEPVPTCPGWTLRDLVEHLGQVHQWVCTIVETGVRQNRDETAGADGADLASWYDERVRRMLKLLAATDPERECWTHQRDNRRVAYWSRRQAHETAMHRVDADLALGGPVRYEPELAADGIGEVLDLWMPRVAKYTGERPDCGGDVLIECTDRSECWLLTPVDDDIPRVAGPVLTDAQRESADARVHGSAASLLMSLWKRGGAEPGIDGDIAGRFVASTLTP